MRLFFIFMTLWAGAALAQPPEPPKERPLDVATALTRSQDWLNTSRPLVADDIRGRVMLLDFWTHGCANCQHVIPDLKKLEQKFGADLTVIGVHSGKFAQEGQRESIRQAIIRHDISHPVVNDADFRIWKLFAVRAWPTLIVLDPLGNVAARVSGEGHYAELEAAIDKLINGTSGIPRHDPLPLALEAGKMEPGYLRFPSKIIAGSWRDGQKAWFVADSGHHRVVAMTPSGQVLGVIGSGVEGKANGRFEEAQLSQPMGMAQMGDLLYIADAGNHTIRVADLVGGWLTTVAGTGKQAREAPLGPPAALETDLSSPWDVAFYPDVEHLVIAMHGLHQLWELNVVTGTIRVLAGSGAEALTDGPAKQAAFAQPSALAVADGVLYVADAETSALRAFSGGPYKQQVTTLIGKGLFDFGLKDGDKNTARMQHPLGMAVAGDALYISDSYNHAIRRYDIKSRLLSTVKLPDGALSEPGSVIEADGALVVADTNHHRLVTLPQAGGAATAVVIKEATQAPDVAISEELPNVKKLAPIVAGPGAFVELGFAPGWHVNIDAPSYLAVFDVKMRQTPALGFDRQMMRQGRMMIEGLAAGVYRMQGQVYYCQDDKAGQCLLTSVDGSLEVKNGGPKLVKLPINSDVKSR